MKHVDLILSADIHLRDTCPEARVDDFFEAQSKKHAFLRELQEKYDAPILVAGDLFHHWKPSPFLLGYSLRILADNMVVTPGQHDLPAHSLENIERSGIHVLGESGKITLLSPDRGLKHVERDIEIHSFPWGVELKNTKRTSRVKVALVHKLVYKGAEPFPGAEKEGGTAKQIIKQLSGFDLVVTGDNHVTFSERVGDTLLVNPGSFMRTTATQFDHKPCVFLYNAKHNEVEQVFLPISKKAVSREHIEEREERDERLEAFVSRLSDDVEIGLSFEENMRLYIAKNRKKINNNVQAIIWETMK